MMKTLLALLSAIAMLVVTETTIAQQAPTQVAQDASAKDAEKASFTEVKATIGNWQGEYFARTIAYRGKVYVTLKAVEPDGKADGIIYMQGPALYHNRDLKMVNAILTNSHLRFSIRENPYLVFNFMVNAKEMTGVVHGGGGSTEFDLRKKN